MSSTVSRTSGRSRERHVLGPADLLEPGGRCLVEVNGREVGLFNLEGEYFALLNYCPHRSGPLCKGRVRPLIVDEGVYGLSRTREGEILKCPWHQWEFDIRSGEALYDPALRVRTYPVKIENGEVVLYV